ncbi:hypothetical protein BD626DRAFT_403580 [Schizophyllum amplum]|uniref:CxC2-like cysteine cluster KDZ transposase-associated domain-containing protein n=1 Tax=Schizophyllum amplum TaxID=97359 RepID=A0A550CDU3_9AGAR|nr:hypothetical protein BD626DRAFT_403580 [Auriculariopsis ampla]
MQAWLPHRNLYLDELVRLEGRGAHGHYHRCGKCGTGTGVVYRCRGQECQGGQMFCKACTIQNHQYQPLHWIEEWTGHGYFARTTLREMGLRFQLGHAPGSICKIPRPANKNFVVIHTNGIHQLAVDFCGCDSSLAYTQQTLRAAWWPATTVDPQTCATIPCLRQFVLLNALGNVSAYDYYRTLAALTNNDRCVKVMDRRHSFTLVVKQYRHISMLKRGGRCHDDGGVNGTSDGELALACPACPHPDINLPPDWRTAAQGQAFKYWLFLAEDANFRICNRLVSNDEKDPVLGDGWGYMVKKDRYHEVLKKSIDADEVRGFGYQLSIRRLTRIC